MYLPGKVGPDPPAAGPGRAAGVDSRPAAGKTPGRPGPWQYPEKGRPGAAGQFPTKGNENVEKSKKGRLSKRVQGPAREEKTGQGPARGREPVVRKEGELPLFILSRQQEEGAGKRARGIIPTTGPARTGETRQKKNQTRELVQLKTMYKDLLMKTLARALAPLYEPGAPPRTPEDKNFLYCRK